MGRIQHIIIKDMLKVLTVVIQVQFGSRTELLAAVLVASYPLFFNNLQFSIFSRNFSIFLFFLTLQCLFLHYSSLNIVNFFHKWLYCVLFTKLLDLLKQLYFAPCPLSLTGLGCVSWAVDEAMSSRWCEITFYMEL